MGWKPEYIVSQVVKRRENIQHMLSTHYLTKGCQSAEAKSAQDHYRAFSELDTQTMQKRFE